MTTIRQRLTGRLLLALGLLISAGGLAVYFSARVALQAQFDATLRARAQTITTLTEEKKGRVKVDLSHGHLEDFEADGHHLFELRLADGTTVEHSGTLGQMHLPLRVGALDTPVFWNLTLADEEPRRAIGIRFRPQGSRNYEPADVETILVVASSRRDLDRTLATLRWVLAGGGLVLLAGTAGVVPRVLRSELIPLQRLADEAVRIDADRLSARFPTRDLPGELAPIATRLNELLGRLEDSFARERQFSSDVAHEFRTPLAELRCLAELALKLPDARAASTDHDMLAIASHLESILSRLLALARGERLELLIQDESVSLAPMIEETCRALQPKAAARRMTFRWQVETGGCIRSDPHLLRSILTNLLDNAVEYSPEGGTVDLEARVDRGRFLVRVTNPVQELDEGDLPRLFDRFWRKDSARATVAHTGLGLPLARTFAGALGCTLTAAFVSPKRLAMTLAMDWPGEPVARHENPPSGLHNGGS
jgi:two-component system sensor histidine kinase QseC